MKDYSWNLFNFSHFLHALQLCSCFYQCVLVKARPNISAFIFLNIISSIHLCWYDRSCFPILCGDHTVACMVSIINDCLGGILRCCSHIEKFFLLSLQCKFVTFYSQILGTVHSPLKLGKMHNLCTHIFFKKCFLWSYDIFSLVIYLVTFYWLDCMRFNAAL